jgi:tRNA (guanine37-N1)-methyltransferase
MRFDILTLFPAICEGALGESILRRARDRGLVGVHTHDLRAWCLGKHRQADDAPFGGGAGMVLKPEPLFAAIGELRAPGCRVLLMSPQGRRFDQAAARRLAGESHLLLVCGHYEGVDQRVVDALVDEELSIGDYVLTNGALAAAVVVDAVARLLPGVLGDETSAIHESFADGLLEAPQYTRPAEFAGRSVPPVLLGGNHAEIARWRRGQAAERTRRNRPDLWQTWLERRQHCEE